MKQGSNAKSSGFFCRHLQNFQYASSLCLVKDVLLEEYFWIIILNKLQCCATQPHLLCFPFCDENVTVREIQACPGILVGLAFCQLMMWSLIRTGPIRITRSQQPFCGSGRATGHQRAGDSKCRLLLEMTSILLRYYNITTTEHKNCYLTRWQLLTCIRKILFSY